MSSGGLGVRLATDLALPTFLSSRLHAASGNCDPVCVAACLERQTRCSSPIPDSATVSVQKVWDVPLVSLKRELLTAAENKAGHACHIAAAASHSGDFLDAVSCSSVGTRLDDTSLRIAVSLRLGAAMCTRHMCVCGQQVDSSDFHGLACRKSVGRHV